VKDGDTVKIDYDKEKGEFTFEVEKELPPKQAEIKTAENVEENEEGENKE
jgi:ATP-dependent Clp protease ATP-binding subunit ClpC